MAVSTTLESFWARCRPSAGNDWAGDSPGLNEPSMPASIDTDHAIGKWLHTASRKLTQCSG